MTANKLTLRRIFGGIGAACSLLGLSLGWQLTTDLLEAYGSKSWPQVSGVLQVADIRYIQRGSGPTSSYWHVDVQYDYEVGGIQRHNAQITPGGAQSYSNLATYKSQFQAGDSIAVYYNPKDPTQSVLLPGINNAHWVGLAAPTLFLAFGGLFGYGFMKLRSNSENHS
jgi:hypothetical protein